MPKKIYAIKEGFDFENNIKVENKIVHSWNECLKCVKGVKGAKYKSFISIEEAEKYLGNEKDVLKKGIDDYPKDAPHFYVDGSYNSDTEKYSYALVVVEDGVVSYIENGVADDNSAKSIRQIAGELEASIKSIEYAAKNNYKNIVIIHDYIGICYHATGMWDRKEESSKRYYEIFNKTTKENDINVIFVKVDSHTGDLYNEIVDEFAKSVAGISVKGETKKLLKIEKIKVKNKEIKEKFTEIVGANFENQDNIEVVESNTKDEFNKSDVNCKIEDEIEKMKNMIGKDKKQIKEYIKSIEEDVKNELIYFFMNK